VDSSSTNLSGQHLAEGLYEVKKSHDLQGQRLWRRLELERSTQSPCQWKRDKPYINDMISIMLSKNRGSQSSEPAVGIITNDLKQTNLPPTPAHPASVSKQPTPKPPTFPRPSDPRSRMSNGIVATSSSQRPPKKEKVIKNPIEPKAEECGNQTDLTYRTQTASATSPPGAKARLDVTPKQRRASQSLPWTDAPGQTELSGIACARNLARVRVLFCGEER